MLSSDRIRWRCVLLFALLPRHSAQHTFSTLIDLTLERVPQSHFLDLVSSQKSVNMPGYKYDRLSPRTQQLLALIVLIFFARVAWLTHEVHINTRHAAGPPQLLQWSWMPDRLKTEYIQMKRRTGIEKSAITRVQEQASKLLHSSKRAVAK